MEVIDVKTVSTTPQHVGGKLVNFDPDGLLITIEVGGTGHDSDVEFAKWVLTATLKNSLGDPMTIFDQCKLVDLFKLSDHLGGFSLEQKGDAAGMYSAYIPLGNIMLDGDDSLDLDLYAPGHATATYSVRIAATDYLSANERILSYESATGTGNELNFRNVSAIYLTSAPSGAQVSIKDMEKQYVDNDKDIISAGSALGKNEVNPNIGILYADRSGYTQNVYVKVPSGATILVCKQLFPLERVARKAMGAEVKREAILRKIQLEDPKKYEYLVAMGIAA